MYHGVDVFADALREKLLLTAGTSPTPKVVLRVAQGCNAKRATLGSKRPPFFPAAVIVHLFSVGNNPVGMGRKGEVSL